LQFLHTAICSVKSSGAGSRKDAVNTFDSNSDDDDAVALAQYIENNSGPV